MRMKMPDGGPLRILSEERGVAGLMVAITMVVLLGMVALSMDFGLMLVKRRATANANDAAALAAAGSCARGDGQADADGRADTYATDNVSNAVRADDPAYDPSCDASAGGGSCGGERVRWGIACLAGSRRHAPRHLKLPFGGSPPLTVTVRRAACHRHDHAGCGLFPELDDPE